MKYRIHGDNIIECERELSLLQTAFDSVAAANQDY